MKAQLYEVTRVNAVAMAGGVITLAVAACVLGLVPAGRAAYVDPVKALRME
jgi:ABC-type antimicrobial peptide transport system permease subunit